MCGISVVIRRLLVAAQPPSDGPLTSSSPSLCIPRGGGGGIDLTYLSNAVARRGPDVTRRLCTPVPGGNVTLDAQGSVLHMRGETAREQPAQVNDRGSATVTSSSPSPAAGNHSSGSWLLWNGEVFGGHSVVVPPSACDTDCVLEALITLERKWFPSLTLPVGCDDRAKRLDGFLAAMRDLLEGIEGPFAIIYYAASAERVVYARDPTGRRSLVVHRCQMQPCSGSAMRHDEGNSGNSVVQHNNEEEWIVASVAGKHVGAETLHCFDDDRGRGDDGDQNVHGRGCGAEAAVAGRSRRGGKGADGDEGEGGDGGDDGCARGCWEEVPANGLYVLALGASDGDGGGGVGGSAVLRRVPWRADHTLHPTQRGATARPGGVVGGDTLHVPPSASSDPCSPASGASDGAADGSAPRTGTRHTPTPMVGRVLDAIGYVHDPHVDASEGSAMMYLNALADAVRIRVVPHTTGNGNDGAVPSQRAPVALLFSGGIDSTVLAALAHYALPLDVPIELVNVAFGDYPEQTPDRIGSVLAMHELLALPALCDAPEAVHQRREWRLVLVDVPTEASIAHQPHVLRLIYPRTSVMDLNIGTAIWFAARGIATTTMRLLGATSATHRGRCSEATTAGGSAPAGHHVDDGAQPHSTVVIKNKLLRIAAANHAVNSVAAAQPTPKTNRGADDAFQALVDVLIMEGFDGNGDQGGNVLLSTLGKEYGDVLTPVWQAFGYRKLGPYLNDAARAGAIAFGGGATSKFVRLTRPDDIAKAQQRVAGGRVASLLPYCADRCGTTTTGSGSAAASLSSYRCQSKVLLVGMGADETLGGYMRYRRVFERLGHAGLKGEMQRDFGRLWTRNLGRDDRMLSDHGREGRFPFLDDAVLRTLGAIAAGGGGGGGLSDVVDVAMPEGVGDKKLLRTCARMLGLDAVSKLQKRAIQFGTRVANRKVQGNAKLQQLPQRPTASSGVPLQAQQGSDHGNEASTVVAAAPERGSSLCTKRPRSSGDGVPEGPSRAEA